MSVLDKILEKRFFAPWREGRRDDPASLWPDSNLELYVTAACNQNCEYCYLVRHEELYPREAMKPGDLMYFPGHVAMYLGEGKYIHSTGKAGSDGVVVNSLDPEAPDFRADLKEKLTGVGSYF